MCETALGAAILIHHSFEGNDKLSYGCLFQGKVSIRAPARGATNTGSMLSPSTVVSIRAPARGATTLPPTSRRTAGSFNSRSREGSDQDICDWFGVGGSFNSRSREGSDFNFFCSASAQASFNSRSREGSDEHYRSRKISHPSFQFAFPRGERLSRPSR